MTIHLFAWRITPLYFFHTINLSTPKRLHALHALRLFTEKNVGQLTRTPIFDVHLYFSVAGALPSTHECRFLGIYQHWESTEVHS
jgi:hypothetical protein